MSTEVYSVVTDDRRSGIAVKVFSNYKKARAWVAELTEMHCSYGYKPEDFVHRGSKDRGSETWSFGESDCIALERKDLL
jgi:hypothetical protein